MFLGNITKDFSAYSMENTGLNGYVYDFSVDSNAIVVNDILDIHKYLNEKAWYSIKCLDLLRKCLL